MLDKDSITRPTTKRQSNTKGKHIVQNNPLPKGQSCASCRLRKVRCDAGIPACKACLRTARFEGRDLSDVRCDYGQTSSPSSLTVTSSSSGNRPISGGFAKSPKQRSDSRLACSSAVEEVEADELAPSISISTSPAAKRARRPSGLAGQHSRKIPSSPIPSSFVPPTPQPSSSRDSLPTILEDLNRLLPLPDKRPTSGPDQSAHATIKYLPYVLPSRPSVDWCTLYDEMTGSQPAGDSGISVLPTNGYENASTQAHRSQNDFGVPSTSHEPMHLQTFPGYTIIGPVTPLPSSAVPATGIFPGQSTNLLSLSTSSLDRATLQLPTPTSIAGTPFGDPYPPLPLPLPLSSHAPLPARPGPATDAMPTFSGFPFYPSQPSLMYTQALPSSSTTHGDSLPDGAVSGLATPLPEAFDAAQTSWFEAPARSGYQG
ncbi:hypothetical protein JCM10908_000546 [Rhodotorula pacifica]|uniref:Zn(II)2Cys6 transcription factor domain-containing protein n=1 Tax=Rhodotorula pacifica TaxID=1495444 RepID=UPI003173AD5D